MTTYLKYRPAWLQLLIFGSLVFACYILEFLLIFPVVSKIYGISMMEYLTLDASTPFGISALKSQQIVFTITSFLLPAVIFAYLSDNRPIRYIGFKKPNPFSFYILGVIIILISLPMVAWLIEVNQHMHLPQGMEGLEKRMRSLDDKGNDMIRKLLVMKSAEDLVVMLIIMAALPALAEELFFRGVLQRLFIQIFKRPWVGIITVAAIFSAMHGQFTGFFPRFVLGTVLGSLYWNSGSLWPGVLAHFIYNGSQVVLIYKSPQFIEKEPDFSLPVIALSTLAVAGLLWWMHRISQTTYAEMYDTDDFHIGPRDEYMHKEL